jgi:hypothetical protein
VISTWHQNKQTKSLTELQGENSKCSQARWYTPIISALGRLRQEDFEFKTSLGHTMRPYLKKEQQKTNQAKPIHNHLGSFSNMFVPFFSALCFSQCIHTHTPLVFSTLILFFSFNLRPGTLILFCLPMLTHSWLFPWAFMVFLWARLQQPLSPIPYQGPLWPELWDLRGFTFASSR